MKGFILTTFALFITIILIILVMIKPDLKPLEDKTGKIISDETFYFLKSLEFDINRVTEISGRRALASIIDLSLKLENMSNSTRGLEELFFNGTYHGERNTIMENSSMNEWKNKVISLGKGKYAINISFHNFSTDFRNFSVYFNYTYDINISDLNSRFKFNSRKKTAKKVSIEQLEDPLIFINTNGLVSKKFKMCNTTYRAKLIDKGNQTTISDWVYGYSIKLINATLNILKDIQKDRIAVVQDLCSYNQSELNELEKFKAIISQEKVNLSNPCNGTITLGNFIGGVNFNLIPNNTYLVLNMNQIWVNNILKELEEQCYFKDSLAPSFFDRIENRTLNHRFEGIGSFLDLENFPQELRFRKSSIDYVYFNNSNLYGNLWRIKGVSEIKPLFLLDQYHIDLWNISYLAY